MGELKLALRHEKLQYKHVADADQHVPGDTNTWLTLMLPLAIVLLISIVRRSLKEAHHAALALWAGYNFNGLVTSTLAPTSPEPRFHRLWLNGIPPSRT